MQPTPAMPYRAAPTGEFLDVAPAALLALPAYAALAVASGAGAYGLAHYVADSNFTLTFYGALALSLLVAYGAQHGSATIGRWCERLKWLLVGGALPILIVYNFQILLPQGFSAESQQILATLVGWVMIASVLSVGVRILPVLSMPMPDVIAGVFGTGAIEQGEAPLARVPLVAPLVSTISLFGVLNNASVDTGITVAFLIHVVAALYLVVYEYMLRLLARQAAARQLLRHAATGSGGTVATWNLRVAPFDISGVALQYLLACSIWFACFTVGGLMLYYPAKAILPALYRAPPGIGAHDAFMRSQDWRGSPPTLELMGGTYNLSDLEILRITVDGESDGLWRGRIYENYQHSAWVAAAAQDEAHTTRINLQPEGFTDLHQPPPPIAAQLGTYRPLTAQVETLNPASRALYVCGAVLKVSGPWQRVRVNPTGTLTTDRVEPNQSYTIVSAVTHANLRNLAAAPGLSPVALTVWRNNPATLKTLELPDEPSGTSDQITAIAQGITQAAQAQGHPLTTPYQKVQAVNDYLRRACAYSLVTPNVPRSEDAVVFFLTRSHEGACDMFASSMAMLLRAMNVPARIATGYLEPGPEDQTSGVDGTSFIERERDAHAWTQYYVSGIGWLDFDPTQGTRTSHITFAMRLAGWLHLGKLNLRWQTLLLPGAGLLLLLIGGIWSVLEARQGARHRGATPQEIERSRITGAYGEAVRLLTRHVPHAPHHTPQEYEAAVTQADLIPAIKQDFAALTYLFTTVHYAPLALPVEEAQLQSCLHRLRQNLK